MYPTSFSSSYELAELPWFEVENGRVIRDPELGPAIDVHTHLALSFIRKSTVDLTSQPGPTEHYLPLTDPVDLDVYQNRNFTPETLSAMKKDLGLKGITGIEGMRNTHTTRNLVHEMHELGITNAVLLPIELPRISRNAEDYLAAAERHAELISFGSVHPFERNFAERLEQQKRAGAKGVKIHPAVQMLPPDHKACMRVYRVCGALDLPVFWHCGPVDIEGRWGRYCSQLKHYWRAVHDNPGTTFVLGHSGALQVDQGIALAQRYDNVYSEIASQSVSNVKRLVEELPPHKLMFGTDWPFYHQAAGLAKVLIATEGDSAARSRVLYENAADLLGFEVE